ncbi:MAG: hypothetical protein AAGE93_10410 [Bacteroidota bacterium]
MKDQSENPGEKLLTEIERNSRRLSRISEKRFKLRAFLITIRILIIKKLINDDTEADRRIVKLLSREIFIKGRTPSYFQDNFYWFLDECRVRKSEEEFKYLVHLFKEISLAQ